MKKIKKKKSASQTLPAFLIGWTYGEAPPPGYLASWFNQMYGGPLHIRFLSANGHNNFEATHTNWTALLNLSPSSDILKQWTSQLQWDHSQLGLLFSPTQPNADRRDEVLHVARMARGLTLLTEGTIYDISTGVYMNPSDWHDRRLENFQIEDHIHIEQHDDRRDGRIWFHTRGLTKFKLDEVETFQAKGLSGQEVQLLLNEVASQILVSRKNPKVGESVSLAEEGLWAEVVGHRTDPIYGHPLALREIKLVDAWDDP